MNNQQKRNMTRRFTNFVNPTTMRIKNNTRMRTNSARNSGMKSFKQTEHVGSSFRKSNQMKVHVQRSKYQMIGANTKDKSMKFAYRA